MIMLANDVDVGALLGDAGMTILIGLVVVFAVLLLLTGIFKLFGMVVSGIEGTGKTAAPAADVPAPAAAAATAPAAPAVAVGNTETVSTAPAVQNGIPDETVAAIGAVVAALAPAGTQYAVSGIRKLDERKN